MTGRRILFIAFLFFASIVVYHFAKPFVEGKRCMDAGGRWDTQSGACRAPFAEPKDE
jgi:hypothetical protein